MKEKIVQKIILLPIFSTFGLECGLHDVFFNVSNFLHNMADTVERTLDEFAKLLKTIFEEDDDPKGISSDNESNWDS